MNVILFIGGLGTGGAERVCIELANFLVKRHQVTILTLSSKEPTYEIDKEVRFQPLEKKRKSKVINDLDKIWQLFLYINSHLPDIYVSFLSIPTYLLLLMKHWIKCPVVFTVRNEPSEEYGEYLKKLITHSILKRADGAIFQLEKQKEYFHFPDRVLKVTIPNAIREDWDKDAIDRTVKGKRIISVGRLTKQKNFQLLINAFIELPEIHKDCTLYIYGEGEERRTLENLISTHNMTDKIFLPGISEKINVELANSDLFVMTSNYEGIPNALLEAMIMGVPVISTDFSGGGARLLIEDNINGIIVKRDDKEELKKAIKELIENDFKRKRLGRKAVEVNLRFCPQKIYSLWEKYIVEVVREKG